MPLPTWYRVIRTLPGVVFGLAALVIGIYLITAPVSYRDPNNPKLVAYANQMHPVVIAIGVITVMIGLALSYFGVTRYFRMPEYIREYSFEQLRLGQALAREIVRLTEVDRESPYRSVEYDNGAEVSISAWNFFRTGRRMGRILHTLNYGLGETVSYNRAEPPTEADGVLHVPEVHLTIDTFSGKSSRHEMVAKYEIVEEPPVIDPDSPLAYAIREFGEDEEWEGLIEPRFRKTRLPYEEKDDPGAYYRFMRQMGLDRPSAEELRIALDDLKTW